jgi:L-ascorbate metabolism protein UlaG (beta-lactamase superfamily)
LLEYSRIKIFWLGHDCFRIEGSVTIYTDPFRIANGKKADIILVTHSHFDHLSLEDIVKIKTDNTIIIAPDDCKESLEKIGIREIITIDKNEKIAVGNVNIEAIPAYNTNKFRKPGVPFHSKDSANLGYIFTLDNVKMYHMGDTDLIPEINTLDIDILFIPVSGTYVMTHQEATLATLRINPKVAIPMHYGSIIGNNKDAESFKKNVRCKVEIMDQESNSP